MTATQTQRSRAWCFTINNWTEAEHDKVMECFKGVEYGIVGKEVGEQGTPHLQGYCRWKNARTMEQAAKLIGARAHLIKAKGCDKANQEYCSKGEDVRQVGKPSATGHRTDLEKLRDELDKGATMRSIMDMGLMNPQQVRVAEKYLSVRERQRDWKTYVIWLYGGSGLGKTRDAYDLLGKEDTWYSGETLKWWQGYDGHANVLIDDFRKDFCKYHTLLRILDRYPYTIEVKGGSRQLLAKTIIITAPKAPWSMYKHRSQKDLTQLTRRIDEVWEYTENSDLPLRRHRPTVDTEVEGNSKPQPPVLGVYWKEPPTYYGL